MAGRVTPDLVSYFFLRAASIARSFGFLAVNTIAQGYMREVALDALLAGRWHIARATRSRPWPGAAGVHIAQVWLSLNQGNQPPVLDGVNVRAISALLREGRRNDANPYRLLANRATAFNGSYVLGMGFVLSQAEVDALIGMTPAMRMYYFRTLTRKIYVRAQMRGLVAG